MTRISLVSTIQVCDVPRRLNPALNWAFDEADWHNALPSDVPAGDLLQRIQKAFDTLWWADDAKYMGAAVALRPLLRSIKDNPDARVVVE